MTTPFIQPPQYYDHILLTQTLTYLNHSVTLKTPLMRAPHYLRTWPGSSKDG